MKETKLHIIIDADTTLGGTLLETRREKVLEFSDKSAAWAHLYRERGRSYERLIPVGVADPEGIQDIYVLKKDLKWRDLK